MTVSQMSLRKCGEYNLNRCMIIKIWFCNEKKRYLCTNFYDMSTKEKLKERFKKQPKDFTFDELITLLFGLGFEMSNKGKTSGSRVRFQNQKLKIIIDIHKPHSSGAPINEIALKSIFNSLINNNLI